MRILVYADTRQEISLALTKCKAASGHKIMGVSDIE